MIASFTSPPARRAGLAGALALALAAAPIGFGVETGRPSNATALARSGGVLTPVYSYVEVPGESETGPHGADPAAEGVGDGERRIRRDISGVMAVDAPAETDPAGAGIRARSLDSLNAAHASIKAAAHSSPKVRIGEIYLYLSALDATPDEGIAGDHTASPADRDGIQDAAEAIAAAGEHVDPVATAIASLLLRAVASEEDAPGTDQGDANSARIRPAVGTPHGSDIE